MRDRRRPPVMSGRRDNPFAILDEGGSRRRLRSLIAPLIVLVAFLAVMFYVSTQLDDDEPDVPSVNTPLQP